MDETSGQRVADFLLGQWDEHGSTVHVDPGERRLVQHYGNGQTCDLTGRPRTVEVRYVCNERSGSMNYLEALLEPTTCSYVLTMVSPLICAMPGMQEKRTVAPRITCKELDPWQEAKPAGATQQQQPPLEKVVPKGESLDAKPASSAKKDEL